MTQPVKPVRPYKVAVAAQCNDQTGLPPIGVTASQDEPESPQYPVFSAEKWDIYQFFDCRFDYWWTTTVLFLYFQLSLSGREKLLLWFSFSSCSCLDPSGCRLCAQRPNVDIRQRLLLQLCPSATAHQPPGAQTGLPQILQHHGEGPCGSTDLAGRDSAERHLL